MNQLAIDRFMDLQKQGFMKLGRKPARMPKKIEIVACERCRDWHRKGKHSKTKTSKAINVPSILLP